MQYMPARRYRALTLTVSEANKDALHLYNATGFTTRHRFDALVLDKPAHRPIPWPPFHQA
jgi:ribosomal protein S18 acetylase RimI-like enzyme